MTKIKELSGRQGICTSVIVDTQHVASTTFFEALSMDRPTWYVVSGIKKEHGRPIFQKVPRDSRGMDSGTGKDLRMDSSMSVRLSQR